jgi:quercetin dioxygenase-like cupin family protein
MRIVDFGPEHGFPITKHGSEGLRGVGLVRPDVAGVIVLHIDAGGEIGRHPAVTDQLFVVASGSGAACGDDGIWHPIAAGQAAFWTAGEHHTTRADEPLTAVVIEMPQMPLIR